MPTSVSEACNDAKQHAELLKKQGMDGMELCKAYKFRQATHEPRPSHHCFAPASGPLTLSSKIRGKLSNMAEELSGLIDSVAGLRLADAVGEVSGPDFCQKALVEAIRALLQTAEATAKHAQQAPLRHGQDFAYLSSLRSTANALASTANALASITATVSDETDRYAVSYITALAGPETQVQKALSHFDVELRSIARSVLDSSSDDSSLLREILELCYNQSLRPSGTLHFDNYFIPLNEGRLGWPYDADFESEEYYEHEERLGDDVYAEAFRIRCERKSESERKQREEWIGFWVRAISTCPNGSTLFYSPASRHPQCHLADVPRYLFRAFDQASSGWSDSTVIASIESISTNSPGRSRVDLLSRSDKEAAEMLHTHLTKPCFGGKGARDNLMSWSSSLLFVIQYAIWRSHRGDCAQDEVKICAIDTRKFPRGQFARDMSLLRFYRQTSALDEKQQSFFDFRLKNAGYDNGEYLSQGAVYHAGKSCVFSLGQLVSAGLHDLYPEFAEPDAKRLWTKRVQNLRSVWSAEYNTTRADVETALRMARACFSRFHAPDVALLLLSLRNRSLRATTSNPTTHKPRSHNVIQEGRGNLGYGPDEVQRYMDLADVVIPEDREVTIEDFHDIITELYYISLYS